MTNCQGEKSNSRPTGIIVELKKKSVYNRKTRKQDTKVYGGIATIEATRTILVNVLA